MALTLFWRAETTTLSGTDDFSAGDNTAGSSGSPTLDAAAALVGSLGILGNANTRYYQFTNSPTLLSTTVGAFAILLRVSALPSLGAIFADVQGSDADNFVRLRANNSSGVLNLRISTVGPVVVNLNLSTAIVANTVYGVIVRWDQPNNSRSIELYDSSGVLIDSNTNTTTAYTAPTELGATCRFGNVGVSGVTAHVDNCFCADAYDEPIEDFMSITSYTEYGVSGSQPTGRMLLTGIG